MQLWVVYRSKSSKNELEPGIYLDSIQTACWSLILPRDGFGNEVQLQQRPFNSE